MSFKTINVDTATNQQLNWLVAKCEEHQSRCEWMLEQKGYRAWQSYEEAWGNPIPDYCGDPAAAYPIIYREVISVVGHDPGQKRWNAHIQGIYFIENCQTPLIAAMRCFVKSKLGNTVKVPEELI